MWVGEIPYRISHCDNFVNYDNYHGGKHTLGLWSVYVSWRDCGIRRLSVHLHEASFAGPAFWELTFQADCADVARTEGHQRKMNSHAGTNKPLGVWCFLGQPLGRKTGRKTEWVRHIFCSTLSREYDLPKNVKTRFCWKYVLSMNTFRPCWTGEQNLASRTKSQIRWCDGRE